MTAGFRLTYTVSAREGRAVDWDGQSMSLPGDLLLYSAGERECRVEDS